MIYVREYSAYVFFLDVHQDYKQTVQISLVSIFGDLTSDILLFHSSLFPF